MTGSPAILLTGLGLAALLVIAPSNGGYGPSDWYPAALFVLGLLAVGVLAMPRVRQAVPAVRFACLALATVVRGTSARYHRPLPATRSKKAGSSPKPSSAVSHCAGSTAAHQAPKVFVGRARAAHQTGRERRA